jgi:hypothetical protein
MTQAQHTQRGTPAILAGAWTLILAAVLAVGFAIGTFVAGMSQVQVLPPMNEIVQPAEYDRDAYLQFLQNRSDHGRPQIR